MARKHNEDNQPNLGDWTEKAGSEREDKTEVSITTNRDFYRISVLYPDRKVIVLGVDQFISGLRKVIGDYLTNCDAHFEQKTRAETAITDPTEY